MTLESIDSFLKKAEKLDFSIKAVDDDHQIVYGEVYAPDEIDTQDDFAPADVIQKMAWDFLANGRTSNIDVMHDFKQSGAEVVESFIARDGDPLFTKGAWVLATRLPDELWEKVKKGELNGYSLAGFLEKYPVTVDVQIEERIEGNTEIVKTDDVSEHAHPFLVLFDDEGSIVFGKAFKTAEADHEHNITKTTATEQAEGHAHRFVV